MLKILTCPLAVITLRIGISILEDDVEIYRLLPTMRQFVIIATSYNFQCCLGPLSQTFTQMHRACGGDRGASGLVCTRIVGSYVDIHKHILNYLSMVSYINEHRSSLDTALTEQCSCRAVST